MRYDFPVRYHSPNLAFGIGFYTSWAIGIMLDSEEGFHFAIGPFAIWWSRI